MEAKSRILEIYQAEDGSAPYSEWIETYEGQEIHGVILGRILRVQNGNFGHCRWEGSGVFELKIDKGPGYRVYFGQDGDTVILLWGGIKRTQRKDLKRAKAYWKDYNA